MKKSYKIYVILFLAVLLSGNSLAQTPTYNLKVMNLQYYGCPADILEFDIYMEHTNPSINFFYSAAQFFFDFNPAIANGGTLTYQIVNSDLPPGFQPRNPTVSGSQLRLAANSPQGVNNAFSMTNNGNPGTRIVRMRLRTSAQSFANVPLDLEWRNSPQGNPFTKVYAYIGVTNIDITTANTHTINNSSSSTCERFLLSSPLFNSPTNPLPVTFSWSKALQAVYYRLQVSTDQNFTSFVFNESGIVDTFKTIGGLVESTKYYWRVSAMDNTSYYLTSDTWYFNTGFPNNSQVPTYNLTATNFTLNSPDDNQLEFDIYIEHTNSPSTFEYALGQYLFNFNPLIANGGTLTYEIVSSDLPLNLQPRNPSVSGSMLQLTGNTAPGAGFGYNMTNNGYPGTKIVRMKLSTSAPQFAIEPLNLVWRQSVDGIPYTKIHAYVGPNPILVTTEITTPNTHVINYNAPLPVELSAFTSTVTKNNVTLNWSTANETNNSGFEIERTLTQDGKTNWIKAGFITGHGTTEEIQNYVFTERLNSGIYSYRLKQIDHNGNFEYHNLQNEINVGIPLALSLSQNYPNPFNPSTKIDFELPYEGNVKINLYDVSGREIATLINEYKSAGYYTVLFNGSALSSGIYFYRMETGGSTFSKRMMIVK